MLTCLAADLGPVGIHSEAWKCCGGGPQSISKRHNVFQWDPNLPLSLGVGIALQHGLRL